MERARLVNGLLGLFARLPLPVNHAVGAALGWLHWVIPNRTRRVTLANIDYCFPHRPAAWRKRMARRSLIELGKTVSEIGPLWRWDGERVMDLVKGVTGEEAVREAMQAGRGVIMLGPHLGAWEMVGLYCSRHFPITSLYAPPRMEALDAPMREARERMGARLVPTDAGGVRALARALRNGEMAGILPDQTPRRGQGEFAPFFGHPAYTMVLASKLAAKSGAAVFFTFAERLPRGRGFHMHFIPAEPEIASRDLNESLAALNRGVEACIERAPEQYQWSYKRFRERPEGEESIY